MSESILARDSEQAQMMESRAKVKYPMTEEQWARIDRDFRCHAPKADQAALDLAAWESARKFALHILTFTPPGRKQSLAMTHLETAVLYAIEASKRNE